MIGDVREDLEQLVSSVNDVKHKPALKPVLVNALCKFGHAVDAAEDAVDAFYGEVVLQ